MTILGIGIGIGYRRGGGAVFLLVDGSGNVIVDTGGEALAVSSPSSVENA